MDQKQFTYYYVRHNGMLAKGCGFKYWIYQDGEWIRDRESIVFGLINGYDPYEPEGSPYAYGSTSVMDSIAEISYEDAMDLIAEKIIRKLIRKWKKDFKKEKEKWDENPLWPAKLVEVSFTFFGSRYTLYPKDLGIDDTPEGEGFMESIQKQLEKDLHEAGASEIESCGFLD